MSLPDGAEYWWPAAALKESNKNTRTKQQQSKRYKETQPLRKKLRELNPHLTKGQLLKIVMEQGGYLKMEIKTYSDSKQ